MTPQNQITKRNEPVLIACGLVALIAVTGAAVFFFPEWITLSAYVLFIAAGVVVAICRREPHVGMHRQFDEEAGLHSILEELNERDRLQGPANENELKKASSTLLTAPRWKGCNDLPRPNRHDRN